MRGDVRVHDRVHGEVVLPPLVATLCSTPEFFRLDDVRQLGGCSYVYPSATHTRREHSIGVCHLAGVMARHLSAGHPGLVDEDDVLCVQVAGLLHDVGHGPFSHLFEEFAHESDPGWDHEEMGVLLFRRILETVDVQSHFRSPGAHHAAFIELMIRGIAHEAPWPEALVGRSSRKRFLVDIVHSRSSGIDVDKIDYLARDSLAIFGGTDFHIDRLVRATKIVAEDGVWKIAFDEKVAFNVADLYALRARMHRLVYQQRSVKAVEQLLRDLLRSIDRESGGCIRACMGDANAFVDLGGDSVVLQLGRRWAPTALRALRERSGIVRLPLTACIRTKPSCAACNAETDVEDAFCTHCGESTRTRIGVPLEDGTTLSSPGCTVSSEEATDFVRGLMADHPDCPHSPEHPAPRVHVHIVDIHLGAAVATEDPHGRRWREYDPLRRVVFHKNGRVCRVDPRAPLFHIPASKHVRTAHCYLPVGASPSHVEVATAAFRQWASGCGTISLEEPAALSFERDATRAMPR